MNRRYLLYHVFGAVLAVSVAVGGFFPSSAAADSKAPVIFVNMETSAKNPGLIEAKVSDDTGVSQVTLFYRKPGETDYRSIRMLGSSEDRYYREMKQDLGINGPVEYYLVAQDTNGNRSSLPVREPESNPLSNSGVRAATTTAEEIVLGNPEPNAVYTSGEQMIMVTFYRTSREIDLNRVRLSIDQVDRTPEAEFIGNTLIWEPQRPFTDGVHEIEVIAADTNGDTVGPNIWNFTVKTRAAMPLGAGGDFFLGIQRDNRSDKNVNIPLWNNNIDLGLQGDVSWLSWRAGVSLSSEETSFLTTETLPKRQPINRYFFEGRTRFLKIRVGDTNPVFSDLSLNGVLVRGLDVEIKSNRFNANFIYGVNKREINEQVSLIGQGYRQINTETYVNDALGDTLTASGSVIAMQNVSSPGEWSLYEFMPGTPQRDVVGLKMDVAPVRNRFATWNLGFNFFGAQDDSTSLKYRYDPDTQNRYFVYQDSTFATDYKPKKNWVGTLETSLALFNSQTVLSAEFGGTIATENMFSYVTQDIKDQLPDNIDANVFPINGSTQTSFDKLKLKDNIGAGIGDALKSVYRFKLNTTVPIPFTKTRLSAEAYRTPTHYVSLGNPQQRTDIGGYQFDLRTRLMNEQLILDGGYNKYDDNLDQERKQFANDSFALTDLTKTTDITNFSVTVAPALWRQYAPTATVGYRVYNSVNNLDLAVSANDPLAQIDTSTNTLMLSFGGTIPVGTQQHATMLSVSSMNIVDNRSLPKIDLLESTNTTVMLNVNSQMNPLPLSLNTSIGMTSNGSSRTEGDVLSGFTRKDVTTSITMLNVAGTYKWLKDSRLKTTAGFGYIGSSNGDTGLYQIDNTKLTFRLEGEYNLTQTLSAGAQFRYSTYKDNSRNGIDYTEPILGMTLRQTF